MPSVHISTKRLSYVFEITHKYNILLGDSGTGKTTLHDFVTMLNSNDTVVKNKTGVVLRSVPTDALVQYLFDSEGAILVIDESCSLFKLPDIASLLARSNNYFIFITRSKKWGFLPIHTESIFYVHSSGKINLLRNVYTRFSLNDLRSVDLIITEDKKSGCLFLSDLVRSLIPVRPAKVGADLVYSDESGAGASKLHTTLRYYAERGYHNILVVYDAAGYGVYMNLLLEIMRSITGCIVHVLDWDSFEYYVLSSNMFSSGILSGYDCGYESLEQFATERLSMILNNYDKGSLHPCLRRNRCKACKSASGCRLRLKSYDTLLHGGVDVLSRVVDYQDSSASYAAAFREIL